MTQKRLWHFLDSRHLQEALFLMIFLWIFPSAVHAQNDDNLLFKVSKRKIQLKKDQYYYVSGDTITFFADAVVLPEGAMLDRLLRKLPGVEYMWKKKNQDMIGYATVSRSVTDATTDQDKTNLMLSGNTYQ